MIVPPYCSRHCQTRSTNASRPSSSRLVPSSLSARSTCFWVAIPAWSVPRIHFVAPPAHALVADERVLDGAVERVAHVQHAGDVRRRDRDRVVLVRRPLGIGVVQARRQPALDDPRLDLGGLEAGAVLQAGHRARESTQRISADGGADARHRGEVAPERGQVELGRQPAHVAALAGGQVARPRARLAQQRGQVRALARGQALPVLARDDHDLEQDGPWDRATCGQAGHRKRG